MLKEAGSPMIPITYWYDEAEVEVDVGVNVEVEVAVPSV
jgi:hypothetical protein